ncbi:MAG: hypothetical protein ACLPXB_13550 [Thiobacillaceae bacterium]
MNDVTIIFPLPLSDKEPGQLIAPQEKGLGGSWLPLDYYVKLPAIDQGEAPSITYQNLRVVTARLDPCFKVKDDNGRDTCLPQVRLVWQPVVPAVYGSTGKLGVLEARDAAIHTFYTLAPKQFQRLLASYTALVKDAGMDLSTEPLQINPILIKQGLNGRFARELRELLSKYVGRTTLWRVTAMQALVGDDEWVFTGFNVRSGTAQTLAIPRIGTGFQRIEVAQFNHSSFANAVVSPLSAVVEANYLPDVLRAKSINQKSMSAADLAIAVVEIENPAKNSPETVDCVSCHVAQPEGSILSGTISGILSRPEVQTHAFQSVLPLHNTGLRQADTHVLRAAGYIERDLAPSRRLINETANVVRELNGDLTAAMQPGNGATPGSGMDAHLP